MIGYDQENDFMRTLTFNFNCDGCGFPFDRENKLKNHQKFCSDFINKFKTSSNETSLSTKIFSESTPIPNKKRRRSLKKLSSVLPETSSSVLKTKTPKNSGKNSGMSSNSNSTNGSGRSSPNVPKDLTINMVENFHDDGKIFWCQPCDRYFDRESKLNAHMKNCNKNKNDLDKDDETPVNDKKSAKPRASRQNSGNKKGRASRQKSGKRSSRNNSGDNSKNLTYKRITKSSIAPSKEQLMRGVAQLQTENKLWKKMKPDDVKCIDENDEEIHGIFRPNDDLIDRMISEGFFNKEEEQYENNEEVEIQDDNQNFIIYNCTDPKIKLTVQIKNRELPVFPAPPELEHLEQTKIELESLQRHHLTKIKESIIIAKRNQSNNKKIAAKTRNFCEINAEKIKK